MLGEPPRPTGATGRNCVFRGLRGYVQRALAAQDDPQALFTLACLHGLRARQCDDLDFLDGYLPPRVAESARKATAVLEDAQPTPAEGLAVWWRR